MLSMRVAGKLPFSHFLDATKLQSFSEYAKITHKLLNHGKQKKNNRQKKEGVPTDTPSNYRSQELLLEFCQVFDSANHL